MRTVCFFIYIFFPLTTRLILNIDCYDYIIYIIKDRNIKIVVGDRFHMYV